MTTTISTYHRAYTVARRQCPSLDPPDLAVLVSALSIAADAHDVTPTEIISPSRKTALVDARTYVANELRQAGWSLPEIGRALNRDHSTILHHLAKKPRDDQDR